MALGAAVMSKGICDQLSAGSDACTINSLVAFLASMGSMEVGMPRKKGDQL